MIYWLFTDGRDVLTGLLFPLLCCAPMAMLITAGALGASIRRTSDDGANASWLQHVLLVVTYAVVLLMVTTGYLVLLGDQAVQRGRSNASTHWRK